ncbi:urease accessory protein [Plakobranchus ocellatus]|uniref:Urease accessory protein n=1 Tax=Plakobranchus ocellatus TaxID=259542 RepID=A0AAV4DEA8_9GAST|nr:urease accessory protein [Plakobranchus ocellatus]
MRIPAEMTGFPAAKKKPSRGCGLVCIEAVRDDCRQRGQQVLSTDESRPYLRSEITSLQYSYPFRFLLPENCSPSPCRWIYPMSFGGGLVGGDSIKVAVTVGEECACVVTSQESTKVYHCDHSRETEQDLVYTVTDFALLCVLQDPVVCFKGANFHQTQVVKLTPQSNLVFLDWMLSGRSALLESWCFLRYLNCVEIRLLDEVVLRELSDLEDTPYKSVSEGMMGWQACGLCVVLGIRVQHVAEALMDKYSRKRDIGERSSLELVVSISEVSYTVQGQTISGCYLRFLASSIEQASKVIRDITSPLLQVLGADPYKNKL